jgi:hypothetical protein
VGREICHSPTTLLLGRARNEWRRGQCDKGSPNMRWCFSYQQGQAQPSLTGLSVHETLACVRTNPRMLATSSRPSVLSFAHAHTLSLHAYVHMLAARCPLTPQSKRLTTVPPPSRLSQLAPLPRPAPCPTCCESRASCASREMPLVGFHRETMRLAVLKLQRSQQFCIREKQEVEDLRGICTSGNVSPDTTHPTSVANTPGTR